MPSVPGPVGADEGVRLVQGHLWLAVRAFEVLGGLVPVAGSGRAKALLAEASAHAGWAAVEWRARLAVLSNVPAVAAAPPSPGWERMLAAAAQAEDEVAALAGAGRVVLPRLVARHEAHLERCTPVADAPLARTLRQVLADEVAAWHRAERLLHALVAAPGAAQAAAARVAALEAALGEPA